MPQDQAGLSAAECSDPQCIRCLRMKLRATCVAVFLKSESEWRLAGYESDKPSDAAEVEFGAILRANLPEQLWAETDGILINDPHSMRARVDVLKELFKEQVLIAAPVHPPGMNGVRLALRDASDPFGVDELEMLRCYQNCPAARSD